MRAGGGLGKRLGGVDGEEGLKWLTTHCYRYSQGLPSLCGVIFFILYLFLFSLHFRYHSSVT